MCTSSDSIAITVKSGAQAAKSVLKLTLIIKRYLSLPCLVSPRDSSQVYNKFAQKIDDAGNYNGSSCYLARLSLESPVSPRQSCLMVLTDLFSSLLRSIVRVPMTERQRLLAGMNHFATHKAPCLIHGDSNSATMRFEPESLHGANAGLHV